MALCWVSIPCAFSLFYCIAKSEAERANFANFKFASQTWPPPPFRITSCGCLHATLHRPCISHTKTEQMSTRLFILLAVILMSPCLVIGSRVPSQHPHSRTAPSETPARLIIRERGNQPMGASVIFVPNSGDGAGAEMTPATAMPTPSAVSPFAGTTETSSIVGSSTGSGLATQSPVSVSSSVGTSNPMPSVTTGVKVTGGICIYEITTDMYGLGVRIGFYIQAIVNITATVVIANGWKYGRLNTSIMAFALLLVFGMGVRMSSLALEAPLFLALISIVSLPALLEMMFRRTVRRNRNFHGVYLTLAAIYVVSFAICLWGVRASWYDISRLPSQCPVLTGLTGGNALMPEGKVGWTVLFGLGLGLSSAIFGFGCWKCQRDLGRRVMPPLRAEIWIHQCPFLCVIWLSLSLGLWIVCVVSIEMTISRHHLESAGLTSRDLGQWMAFSTGVAAAVGLFWTWFFQRRDLKRNH